MIASALQEASVAAIEFRQRCQAMLGQLAQESMVKMLFEHDRLGSGPVDRHRCVILWQEQPFAEVMTPVNGNDRERGLLVVKKPGDGTFCVFRDSTAVDTIHRLLTIFLGDLVLRGDRAKAAMEALAPRG